MECYIHSGTEATAHCVSCNKWICNGCREEVAGYAMCHTCVQQNLAQYASTQGPMGTGSVNMSSTAPTVASGAPPEPLSPAQYFSALVLGLVAAIVGAFIWDKITLITGYQLGLIAILLGFLVGYAVLLGAGWKYGVLLPWMGALLAGFAILLGYALLAQDVILQDPAQAEDLSRVPLLIRLPLLLIAIIPALDLLDWVFVVIGIWEGWIIPRRAGQLKPVRS